MTYLHYVYAHIRNDTGQLFYVGKGSGKRAYSKGKRKSYWRNVVTKAGGFSASIIAAGLTEDEAYGFERKLISALKSQTDCVLTNLIGGGRGGSYNPSNEVRQKQRIAKLGKTLTAEHRTKISASGRGRRFAGYSLSLTDVQRAHRSALAKAQVWTEDRKRKISEAKLGYKHTEETKAKVSASKKGIPWTAEQRAKIMAGRLK